MRDLRTTNPIHIGCRHGYFRDIYEGKEKTDKSILFRVYGMTEEEVVENTNLVLIGNKEKPEVDCLDATIRALCSVLVELQFDYHKAREGGALRKGLKKAIKRVHEQIELLK